MRRERLKFYASPKGRKYHSSRVCLGLNSWATATLDATVPEVTRREITRRNLIPCQSCKPSPVTLLAIVPEAAS